MYRGLQNVITHLIVYQLNQFVFMRMHQDFFRQSIAKKVKRPPRHQLPVVRHSVEHRVL